MKNGTIENIISYYLENKKFSLEIERAEKEFFGLNNEAVLLSVEEKTREFFMEWLVFDFKLANGYSLLQDYYYLNPHKRPLYEMQVYKDLQNNIYGLLEVQKINLGVGIELVVLHTGEKYYVQEHLATFDCQKGDVFFGRVAFVGGHYELVGANSFKLNVFLDGSMKKHFINKNSRYSPKDASEFLTSNNNYDNIIEDATDFSLDEIAKEADDAIKELGIGEMVNAQLIQKWLLKISFKNPGVIMSILFNLTENEPSSNNSNRLLDSVQKLINHSPQKALRGKSPNELKRGVEFGSKGFRLSIIGKEWPEMLDQATQLLKEGEILKAFNEYNKVLSILLKEKNTSRYIFSVYANLAVCHLYFGEEFMARKLLNTSLEIKNNYEFAKNLINKLDSYEQVSHLAESIRFILKRRKTKKIKDFKKLSKDYSDIELCKAYYDFSSEDNIVEWSYSPAKKYYDFLKKLEIDFTL